MKATNTLLIVLITLLSTTCSQSQNTNEYLKTVLRNLEEIQSATYSVQTEGWTPQDTTASRIYSSIIKEYDNPQDTTIGATFIVLSEKNPQQLSWCYNGKMAATVYEEHKGILIDSFKVQRNLPFRVINPPFYNYTKSILRYILSTHDSISLKKEEDSNSFYLKLTIHEDAQIEFFGKAFRMPVHPNDYDDKTSIYELWIDKKTNLPYKYRREMSHDINIKTVSNAVFNQENPEEVDVAEYLPKGYEIRFYEKTKKQQNSNAHPLLSKTAPRFSLLDAEGNTRSLSDFKSKVQMIQITSVSCGPCKMSIPFLNQLAAEYDKADFDFVAIECNTKSLKALKHYQQKNNIEYTFLQSNDDFLKSYNVGLVPTFLLLDENHVVRKVFNGYSKSTSDKEIRDAVNELLRK